MQRVLFGGGPPQLMPLDRAVRHELRGGGWLVHLNGWVQGHEALFDQLRGALEFRRTERPMYGRVVAVPRGLYHGPIQHLLVDEMQWALEQYLGHAVPHRSAALYEDGGDSVAWHGDNTGPGDQATVVTVSLGAPRRFLVRSRPNVVDPAGTRSFTLGWGDLMIMGGTAQRTYEHCVPKAPGGTTGPRLVVMFRSEYDDG